MEIIFQFWPADLLVKLRHRRRQHGGGCLGLSERLSDGRARGFQDGALAGGVLRRRQHPRPRLLRDDHSRSGSQRLKAPTNVSLLPLPAYSPELNAQENIWQFLRQTYLPNRVFEGYQAIVDASCKAWNALLAETGRITSIATRTWAAISP